MSATPEPGFRLPTPYIRERLNGGPTKSAGEAGVTATRVTKDKAEQLAAALGCELKTEWNGSRFICRICGPKAPVGLCDRDKHDAYYEALERHDRGGRA